MTVSDDTYVADLLGSPAAVNVFGRGAGALPGGNPRGVARARRRRALLSRRAVRLPAGKARGADGAALPGDERGSSCRATTICWHGSRTLAGLERVRELRKGN